MKCKCLQLFSYSSFPNILMLKLSIFKLIWREENGLGIETDLYWDNTLNPVHCKIEHVTRSVSCDNAVTMHTNTPGASITGLTPTTEFWINSTAKTFLAKTKHLTGIKHKLSSKHTKTTNCIPYKLFNPIIAMEFYF